MSEKRSFVNQETKRLHRLGGCIPSEQPSSSPKFAATAKYMSKDLPPAVDLRPFMTPVEDQAESYSWLVRGNLFFRSSENSLKYASVVSSRAQNYPRNRNKFGKRQ